MRALNVALSVVGLSLMMGISGPGQAQMGGGGGDLFKLGLCNKFRAPIKVALVHRAAPGQDRFVARGWFAVDPNSCGEGELPRGPFAIFAYAGTANSVQQVWGGNLRICVNPNADFQTALVPNSRCKQGEVLVGFQAFDQPAEAEVVLTIE